MYHLSWTITLANQILVHTLEEFVRMLYLVQVCVNENNYTCSGLHYWWCVTYQVYDVDLCHSDI